MRWGQWQALTMTTFRVSRGILICRKNNETPLNISQSYTHLLYYYLLSYTLWSQYIDTYLFSATIKFLSTKLKYHFLVLHESWHVWCFGMYQYNLHSYCKVCSNIIKRVNPFPVHGCLRSRNNKQFSSAKLIYLHKIINLCF